MKDNTILDDFLLSHPELEIELNLPDKYVIVRREHQKIVRKMIEFYQNRKGESN